MAHDPVLTDRQQRVLQLLAKEPRLAHAYVLSGGTALAAFYLRHRLSDDLDFFTREAVERSLIDQFIETVRRALSAQNVQFKKLYDRRMFTFIFSHDEELKMEFTQFSYGHLEEPMRRDGVLVDSLRDIAAGKLAAMLDRFEPKDYVDLYFLLKNGGDIREIWRDVQRKFSLLHGPIQVGATLLRARSLPVLPRMLIPVSREEIAASLEDAARTLRPDVVEE